MIVLDTDTLTLLFGGHARVAERHRKEPDEVATTIISVIELLQGRFAMLLKAPDGKELLRAQGWLDQTKRNLAALPMVLSITEPVAAEFDQLRQHKKLKKIGRPDLLIAATALAHNSRVATRNVKDFRLVPGLKVENWPD